MRWKLLLLVTMISVLTAIAIIATRAQPQYNAMGQGWSLTSSAIGGGLLAAGASASTTITAQGVQPGMHCEANPTDGTNMPALGAIPLCTVTATNTITLNLMTVVALTPPSKTYSVRVWQ